jgi:serine/threonine protein kinase
MPASKKPDLIPTDLVPDAPRGQAKDWTISFDTEDDNEVDADDDDDGPRTQEIPESERPRKAEPNAETRPLNRPLAAKPGRATPSPTSGGNGRAVAKPGPVAAGPTNSGRAVAKPGPVAAGPTSGGRVVANPGRVTPRPTGGGAASAVTPRPTARQATRGPGGGGGNVSAESKQVRLLPGRRVPGTRYRLVRWLGEGGMGVVYEAEHEDIERRVALKILRPEASEDPQQAAQFRDEARAASRIGSPNIVEIFDFGELPDGRLMFAMELLNGHGLDGELDKCPMDQARMIGILRQVCKGLAAAHEVGIVHRDVKPDNIILINHSARADWVKIVDFGIATVHSDGDAGAAGTPHYMAPEQVLSQPFDGRLDMYSFGCTAYELLVGKPPFAAPTIDEILENQLTKQAVPPSQLCPPNTVHPALEAVIMRCLEKDPNKRFRDMRDVEAALCEAQIAAGLSTAYDDLPLPDVDPDRVEKLRKEMPQPGVVRPKHRWLWPAIAAASTLSAAALAFAFFFMQKAPTSEEQSIVDTLVDEARAAGSRAQWFYPPPEDLDETSLIKVTALEALDGPAAAYADEKAAELRKEFAETLVRIGDGYWEQDGGKPFARDYYMQALAFDPKSAHARERSGATPGVLADLTERALTGQFSPAELRRTAVLVALAETDTDKRDQALLELVDAEDETSIALASSAEKLIRSSGKAPARKPKPRPVDDRDAPNGGTNDTGGGTNGTNTPNGGTNGAPPNGGTDPTNPAAVPGEPAANGTTPATPTPGSDPAVKPISAPKRDSKLSDKLVQQARAALAGGKRKEAESLFHQALSADNRNAAALIGLSDLEFDRGAHQRAADYAEKAIAASPKSGSYHLKLGDAYFKLLRYADARRAYEKAKDLGVREADERLAKVKSKLGK